MSTPHLTELGRIFAHSMVDRMLASRPKPEWKFVVKQVNRHGLRKPFYIIDFSREAS